MLGQFKRWWGTIVAIVALTSVCAACGSNSPSNSASGSVPTLKISVSAASTLQAQLYVAQEEGYFKKYGVNVEVVNNGTLGPTQVASGQVDLSQWGTNAALAPIAQGRQTSVVYGFAGNIARNVSVGGTSTISGGSTTDVLMQLSGKKLVTQGTSGSGWGNATAVANWIAAHGGQKPTIVGVADSRGITSQLISDQAAACICLPDYFPDAIAQGKIKVPVPNTDPTMTKITGGNIPGISLWGLKSNLQSKSKAVSGVIAALLDAGDYIKSHSADQIAQVLAQSPDFNDQQVATLKTSLGYDKPFFSPNDGYISESSWKQALTAMGTWGTGLTLSDSQYSYPNVVDMSYYDAAKKLRGQ